MFRNPLIDGLVLLLIVLLIFGPKRLPTLGRSLGEGLREFKDSITGSSNETGEERPQLHTAAAPVSAAEAARPAATAPPAASSPPAPAETSPAEVRPARDS